VDAGSDELNQSVWSQVRWRLQVHLGTENDPRHRDGPDLLLERRLARILHPSPRLRPEVLDYDLLDMAVMLGELSYRQQRLDPLAPRLADADQNARREGHPRPPGCIDGREPHRRIL